MADRDLNPSELGTFEYWDKFYVNEITNFKEYGDVGDIWFGNETSKKIVNWLDSNPDISKLASIVDIGCGNGMLLVNLHKKGFKHLTGIDYSKNAIELAEAIALKEGSEIKFFNKSILDNDLLSCRYDIALDKGTYDAISLNPDNASDKRKKYLENVHRIVSSNGLLLMTSCNWTESELIQHFGSRFEVISILPSQTFSFGGQTGNKITSLVFKRKNI